MSVELKARTRAFALDVIKLISQVPKRIECAHIHSQVLRSSSSVAANYRAAFRGRSRIEFLAKLGLVEEECDETHFWLEMLRDANASLGLRPQPAAAQKLQELIREAEELLRIIVAAKKTTRAGIDLQKTTRAGSHPA